MYRQLLFVLVSALLLTGCTSVQETVPSNTETTEQQPTTQEPLKTSGTTEQIAVKLVHPIDGDTIKIMYEGKEMNVRYLLIDTPETNHPRLGEQPFGQDAKKLNAKLVQSGDLTIEFDVGQRFDKYDRLLAYVYVDGKSVQEQLLQAGLARVAYVYPPNTRYLTSFEAVQVAAKKNQSGIWSIDDYVTDRGFDATETPTAPTNNSFSNCTELRKVYPDGVPKNHASYNVSMDRDKDGYACEK